LPDKGFWCRPCFFTGVQPSHVIAREEIFGPVLAVMSFRTPEEAISRANNTSYGLAAGVWTDKGSKIFEIARQLKAGVVWLNTYRFEGDESEIVTLSSVDENRGVGTLLLEHAVDAARRAGCRRVFLTTTNDNLRAIGFYQKRGWRLCRLYRGVVDEARRKWP